MSNTKFFKNDENICFLTEHKPLSVSFWVAPQIDITHDDCYEGCDNDEHIEEYDNIIIPSYVYDHLFKTLLDLESYFLYHSEIKHERSELSRSIFSYINNLLMENNLVIDDDLEIVQSPNFPSLDEQVQIIKELKELEINQDFEDWLKHPDYIRFIYQSLIIKDNFNPIQKYSGCNYYTGPGLIVNKNYFNDVLTHMQIWVSKEMQFNNINSDYMIIYPPTRMRRL